jgi:nitrite reductase/ring-hydroxylating ferredoxin subunit
MPESSPNPPPGGSGLKWFPALPGDEVGNTLRKAEVNGVQVLLGRLIGGEAVAVSPLCPHRNRSMEGGALYTDIVDCPEHHYTYDARTGENRYPKNIFPRHIAREIEGITVYPTREQDGWVWVGLI